jgi:hypothetical protein
MKRRRKDFMPIRAVVRDVMRSLETRTGEQVQEIEAVWQAVVGGDLANLTRVRGIARKTVEIEAVGSPVLAEIEQFYRDTFLRRLKEKGIIGVDRVAFHLADG